MPALSHVTTPDHPDALLQLASQLRRAGRVAEAIDAYERLLRQRPDLADSWYNLAWLQRQARRYDESLASYQQALDRRVDQPEEVHLNRAVIFSDHLARPDDAERELRQALALNPRYLPAWLNLGNLEEDRGQRAAAREAYEKALAIDPRHPLALSRLPNVVAVSAADDPLIQRLRQAIARPGAPADELADLGFGLGKALDDAGAYDDAFAAYSAANRASRAVADAMGARYDPRAHEALVDRLIEAFPTPVVAPATAAEAKPPLFICGLFRSGSTLVEQILAAHDDVTAGGELEWLPALARQHLVPALGHGRIDADSPAVQSMRTQYLDAIRRLFPDARQVTDKRPDNFLYIGLIKAMFPTAKIVHTRRHPLDNGLSLFFLHLGHAMPCATDLSHIAHWTLQYRRLMVHWQSLYPDSIHDVDYDHLVAEPRQEIDQLLRFAGLPWDEACLNFHAADRAVRTASVWQVRQPLYARSSGRWRHYARHLATLQALLGDA